MLKLSDLLVDMKHRFVLGVVMIEACRVLKDGTKDGTSPSKNQLLIWSTSASEKAYGDASGTHFTRNFVGTVRDERSQGHDILSLVQASSAATKEVDLYEQGRDLDVTERITRLRDVNFAEDGMQVPVQSFNWTEKVVVRCHASFIQFMQEHPNIKSIDELVDHFIKYPSELKALHFT